MNLPSRSKIEAELAELEQQLADPGLTRQTARIRELTHQHAAKQKLLAALVALEKIQQEQAEVAKLLETSTPDVQALAEEDAARLTRQAAALHQELTALLIPRDPEDTRDAILEIRAGAGGEEASLFAAELYRAYARYAETVGWQLYQVSSSQGEQGGYKEVIAELAGRDVFGRLKYERGVHRVQRVPSTEKMGRIHTSTVTVAVLPQAEEVDLVLRPEELRIDTYRSGGAGGQHVNKTSSAVRITHLPTNTIVAVQDERSQHKNKDKAMKILRSRLLAARHEAEAATQADRRRTQVGTGDRSEKIRTYNFPQDRITDHRIKESWSNIPGVMNGEWQPIFDTLRTAEDTLKLNAAL